MIFPEEMRPMLLELIHLIDRTSHRYRSTFLHAPGLKDHDWFLRFMDTAERAAAQARHVLDEESHLRGLRWDLRPPGAFLATNLPDQLQARRRRCDWDAMSPPMPSLSRRGRSLH